MKKLIIYPILVLILVSFAYGQPFNTTNLTAANDIYEQTVALNDLLGGIVGLGFVIVAFTITFFVTSANTGSVISGLASGSFIAAFSCIILMPLNLVGFPVFQITLLMLAISVTAAIVIQRA